MIVRMVFAFIKARLKYINIELHFLIRPIGKKKYFSWKWLEDRRSTRQFAENVIQRWRRGNVVSSWSNKIPPTVIQASWKKLNAEIYFKIWTKIIPFKLKWKSQCIQKIFTWTVFFLLSLTFFNFFDIFGLPNTWLLTFFHIYNFQAKSAWNYLIDDKSRLIYNT